MFVCSLRPVAPSHPRAQGLAASLSKAPQDNDKGQLVLRNPPAY